MKRILIALLILVALLIWGGIQFSRSQVEWTTDSEAALAEFESCLDAFMKLYYADAAEHCDRAIELDPQFASAKLMRLNFADSERREELIAGLREADLSTLTPTEQFLIQHRLARVDRQTDEARALLAARLEEAPDDAHALNTECQGAWIAQDWDVAESCYERLLEIDPNWAIAQNHLGYIAMARGDFEGAEGQFETYRFIAPDQANPHDSMGELLTLIGRYEEAAEEFEAALAIRPDFCASYRHLVSLHLMAQDIDRARETAARLEAQEECGEGAMGEVLCTIDAWEGTMRRDWEAVIEVVGRPTCTEYQGDVQILGHAALSSVGRTEDALAVERGYQTLLEEARLPSKERDVVEALTYHMWGARLTAEGDFAGAASRYRQADETLVYWNDGGLGIFKLFNQISLAGALMEAGDPEGANAVLERMRAVNPRFVDDFWG